METLPIAPPTDEIRVQVETNVSRLLVLTKEVREQTNQVLNWLRLEFGLENPGQHLETFAQLKAEAFIREVGKRKSGRLKPSETSILRETYDEYAPQIQAIDVEVQQLERSLSDLINQAYGLTAEEVNWLWHTAPPRMPFKMSIKRSRQS